MLVEGRPGEGEAWQLCKQARVLGVCWNSSFVDQVLGFGSILSLVFSLSLWWSLGLGEFAR